MKITVDVVTNARLSDELRFSIEHAVWRTARDASVVFKVGAHGDGCCPIVDVYGVNLAEYVAPLIRARVLQVFECERSGRSSKWIRRSTRFALYHRDGFDCVYCRGVFPPATGRGDLTLDHVVPRSQGGSDRPDNLVTCCWDCNSARQDRPLTADERRRAMRATSKPLDREAGRALASGAKLGQQMLVGVA